MKLSGVKIIRLMNGEEIIGSMSQTGDTVSVTDPVIIQMIPNGEGQVGLAMIPFAPYAEEDTFIFSWAHIVTAYTPSKDLYNQYNRKFGSGLQLATSL